MAIAFLFDAPVGADEYDAVMKGIGRPALDSPTPEGILAHIAGPTQNGWRVVDIWESEEAAEAFYGSEAFRQAAEANLPPLEPEPVLLHRIEIYETVRSMGS